MKPLELIVLDGEQAGARTALISGSTVTISSTLDCDIVLRDPLIENHKIQLTVQENSSCLKVLGGEVELGGHKITESQEVLFPVFTALKMGGTTLAIGEQDDPRWLNVSRIYTKPTEAESQARPSEQERPGNHSRSVVIKKKTTLYAALTVFMLAGIGLLGATVFGHSGEERPVVSIEDKANEAAKKIQQAGFSGLKVKVGDTSDFVVVGYIDTTEQYTRLEDFISQSVIEAELDIQVGEQLAAEVQNVYRVNGVNAKVKPKGAGVVKVYSSENNIEKLAQLKTIALRDVGRLEKILMENKAPAVVDSTSGGATVVNDPGKRVTMVVPGDPGYVVTLDKSRYFVGSMLPTGHLITGFVGKQVMVEKDGVKTALNF